MNLAQFKKSVLKPQLKKKEYAHGGVWGGLSSKEIDKLVKNRVAARQRQSRNKY